MILGASVLLGAANAPSATEPDAVYLKAYEKWKVDLVDDLKQNWLNLAGLFWLKPGPSSFGTDATNAIVLPQGSTTAHAGSFELKDGKVTVKFAAGVSAKLDPKIADGAELQADVTGHRTTIELGSLRMFVIKRGDRIGIRVRDLDSPKVRDYKGPIFFPINLNYRVTAKWVPSDGKKTVDVPNVLGDITPTPVPGIVEFTLDGQAMQLTAVGGDPAKGLSFVFNDLTAKTDTYPGGRFLDSDPISNGTVVIDFNRAYNPPCAVTPYATCPLAPKDNRLQVAIPAGEKYDRTHGHH
jgi:uncharacterized protein (DUF1684 family)